MNPPSGGSSVLPKSIAIRPDTGDQAERLVREIDLEGFSMVEFRRDTAGVPHIMEINSRLIAGIELAISAGVNFPCGRPGIAPPMRAVRDFCISCFVPTRYDYLDGSDLLPVGTAIAGWCWRQPKLIKESQARRNAQKGAELQRSEARSVEDIE